LEQIRSFKPLNQPDYFGNLRTMARIKWNHIGKGGSTPTQRVRLAADPAAPVWGGEGLGFQALIYWHSADLLQLAGA
jgi:hypothetical protein